MLVTPVATTAMSTIQLTDDDIGKTVVTSTGDEVGIVSGYRYGTAYVDPDPGLKTTLLTKLGWEDTDEDDGYPLQTDAVDTITDEQIRLSSDV
ncbi:PRC-barrel domain containing protein [Haloarcula sp. S1AR25-5A]|uniref:PRC-barrel domain containing protein n=2 Tax=Haloarcula terrestris TaxID=2950533 RepID=A0AAE4JFP3_9EURY|nr:PRC-barrel domain containing protein [Haloarcula terrestris]MDS0220548.1 PRC-barrel domain containing protein [Haloarcula terrestris]